MNGKSPKALLEPFARALVEVFYHEVQRRADTATSAEWRYSHDEMHAVPLGYVVRLRLGLINEQRNKEQIHEENTGKKDA